MPNEIHAARKKASQAASPILAFVRNIAENGFIQDLIEHLFNKGVLDKEKAMQENIEFLEPSLKKDVKKFLEMNPEPLESMEDFFWHMVNRPHFSVPFKPSFTDSFFLPIAKAASTYFENQEGSRVLDLGTGSATTLFSYLNNFPEADVTSVEVSPFMSQMLSLRSRLRGSPINTLTNDILKMKMKPEYDLVVFDIPYGIKADRKQIVSDQGELFSYDLLRGSNAQGAFILKAINAAKDGGTIVVSAPQGFLYDKTNERLRKQMINSGLVKTIIQIPTTSFNGTSMHNSLIVMKKDYKKDPIVFLDLQSLRPSIKSSSFYEPVLKQIENPEPQNVFTVPLEVIENNDYRLNIYEYIKGENDEDFSLPSVPLTEIASVIPGIQKPLENEEPDEDSIGILTLQNVGNDLIVNLSPEKYLSKDEKRASRHLLQEGDILMTSNGSQIRYGLIRGLEGRKLVPAHGLTIIRPEKLPSEYLVSVLNTQKMKNELYSSAPGRRILHFTKKDLARLNVPLLDTPRLRQLVTEFNILYKRLTMLKSQYNQTAKEISELFLQKSIFALNDIKEKEGREK